MKRGVNHTAIHSNCPGKRLGALCLAKGLGLSEKIITNYTEGPTGTFNAKTLKGGNTNFYS
jgi:hypothetical protein